MQSLLGHNTRKPDIIFSASGRIDISARVARFLGLQRGDVLDVAVDSGEYYLYVSHRAPTVGRFEAVVYPTNQKGRHFRAASKRLCAAILRACGTTGKARLGIGTPVTRNADVLLPIITRNLLPAL
ncbi:MAG: hypothetical protein Q4E59_00650 [Bacteroidales bacterium]|nr:hypothetical protein [Bacteroidales bacterium]